MGRFISFIEGVFEFGDRLLVLLYLLRKCFLILNRVSLKFVN